MYLLLFVLWQVLYPLGWISGILNKWMNEWNANSTSPSPEIPRILWFINAFIYNCHLSLSWARSIQYLPYHPTSWKSILILFFHLYLGLISGLLPSGSPNKTPYMPPHSSICGTCPAHLILLELITRTILSEQNRSLSSSLCSFLHSPVTSSLLGPIILLSILLSNTLSHCSSLVVKNQVSHPYKTTGICVS